MKKLITTLAVAGAMSAAALSAGAHPGHGPAIITIDRPAAGKLYVNDAQQPGSVGGAANTATSIGDTLTITVSWKCPPESTTAVVTVVVKDAAGNVVHDAGMYFGGPNASWSPKWPIGASGTYTIEATVNCYHFENDPRTGKVTKVADGNDADSRNVVAIK